MADASCQTGATHVVLAAFQGQIIAINAIGEVSIPLSRSFIPPANPTNYPASDRTRWMYHARRAGPDPP